MEEEIFSLYEDLMSLTSSSFLSLFSVSHGMLLGERKGGNEIIMRYRTTLTLKINLFDLISKLSIESRGEKPLCDSRNIPSLK